VAFEVGWSAVDILLSGAGTWVLARKLVLLAISLKKLVLTKTIIG
jgi:hypothetical protein